MITLDDKDAILGQYRKIAIDGLPAMLEHNSYELNDWLFNNSIDETNNSCFHDRFIEMWDANTSLWYDAWQHIIYSKCENVILNIDKHPIVYTNESLPCVYYITHNLNAEKILSNRCAIMPKSDEKLDIFDKPIYVLSSQTEINESLLHDKNLMLKFNLKFNLINLPTGVTHIVALKFDTHNFYKSFGAKMQFFKDKDIPNCMFTLEPMPSSLFKIYKVFQYEIIS